MTFDESRRAARAALTESFAKSNPAQLRTAALDADIIIAHATGKDRTWILFHRDEEIPPAAQRHVDEMVSRRAKGVPIAYLTGRKEFFGLDFIVAPSVLIPKPDTELLVEQAILEIGSLGKENPSVLDLCAGSGCVGVSIAKSVPGTRVVFADISEDALEVARKNIARHLGENAARAVRSDLFSSLGGETFDIIVSNPPYIPHELSVSLLEDGRGEPILALDGDIGADGKATAEGDGLGIIRRLVPESRPHLSEGGALLVETGEYNARAAADIFLEAGFPRVRIERDMNGMMRNVIGKM